MNSLHEYLGKHVFWGEKETDACPEKVEPTSSGTWKNHFFSGEAGQRH